MSFEGFDFVKHSAQKGRARLTFEDSFVERFLDGIINIAVDFRIKDVDETARVWIARPLEDAGRGACSNLVVQIANQEGEAGDTRKVFADIAIENSEGIDKGRLCRTWWHSMLFGNSPRITPPFWWTTGNTRVDALATAAQHLKYGCNGDLALPDDLFRHTASDFLDIIRGLNWVVNDRGIGIQSLDDRIEVVDAFYGPFN